jgi:hypothetical protein
MWVRWIYKSLENFSVFSYYSNIDKPIIKCHTHHAPGSRSNGGVLISRETTDGNTSESKSYLELHYKEGQSLNPAPCDAKVLAMRFEPMTKGL